MFDKYRDTDELFVIAEVGQNHQGDLDEALRYIEVFANLGADAVKFQMRCNEFLFTKDAFDRPYESENAFGATYGEHRNALEFGPEEWVSIKRKCEECNVQFMCTPFDEPSVDALVAMNAEILKVASFDFGNLPLLAKMCDAGKPIVVSTGGAKSDHIDKTIEFFQTRGADFCVLHCVSEYPTKVERLDLGKLQVLRERYPGVPIGLSDHFNGTLSGPVGYMLGARIFEKHVTLNRANKGTDHSFALEPRGFENFVRDIRRVPMMFGAKPVNELGTEYVFKKLGKSLCAASTIKKGDVFSLENLSGIIDLNHGIAVRDAYKLLGKPASRDYAEREILDISEMT